MHYSKKTRLLSFKSCWCLNAKFLATVFAFVHGAHVLNNVPATGKNMASKIIKVNTPQIRPENMCHCVGFCLLRSTEISRDVHIRKQFL